jgi:hypothetical protein
MINRVFHLLGKRRLVAAGLTAVLVVLAIGLVSLNARPALGAGSGGGSCFSTTGPACTFKGNNASAEFSSVSADGCIFTDVFAQPFTNLTSPGRTTTQAVGIAISKFDDCQGGLLLENVSNFDFATGMLIFNGTLQFGSMLDTAAIIGSAPMFDNLTGMQLFTSTINVSWHGYGPTSKFIDTSHVRQPGFMMNSHFTGVSRSAEASGVVTDETGTNLATPATLNANLSDNTGGTVQFSRS